MLISLENLPVDLGQIAEIRQGTEDCGPGVEGAHGGEVGLGQVAGVVETLQHPERLLLELGAGKSVSELGVEEVVEEVEYADEFLRGQGEVFRSQR